ncbi:MAG TPA: hypothetical protein VHT21_17570 [Stellaceae bacterium]|jgi:hypothetical protein|nr:hypothetical protein [Stellaceae bacterium]
MLDATMQAFQDEMETRKPLRPSGTRRGVEVDTLNGLGAALLADRIKKFWAAAGYDIEVSLIPFVAGGGKAAYALRSNLVAGLPRVPIK